jgi:predicted SnoaL-like aldol condensation-catalyzing enzyme
VNGKNQDKDQLYKRRKAIIENFFQNITQMQPKEGLRLCAPDCRQHNPYVSGGMAELFDSMAAVQKEEDPNYPDPDFSVKRILIDGDFAVAHTELLSSKSDPSKGGLRQAHIFRFGPDNKIAEYWDISQAIDSNKPNAANAF